MLVVLLPDTGGGIAEKIRSLQTSLVTTHALAMVLKGMRQ
jgi:hypothetical protein